MRRVGRLPIRLRFWSKVEKIPFHTCWEWLGGRNPRTGYGYFGLYRGDESPRGNRNETAHRVAWILTHGAIPEGTHILHKCDNRSCVNPDHLVAGSNTENVRDMRSKGRSVVFGHPLESGRGLKLTIGQVREIRGLCAAGQPGASVARQFGVSTNCVSQIRRRRSWAWIDADTQTTDLGY